jgi:NTE family protein
MFVPVSLQNYAGSCGYEVPAWVAEELAQRDVANRRYEAARLIGSYQDVERRPYVHLSDGGNSDNLGLRSPIEAVIGAGGLPQEIERAGFVVPSRVLVVVVDAKVDPDRPMDRSANPPGPLTVVNTLMGVSANRYAVDTLDLLRTQLGAWVERLPVDEGEPPTSLHVTHVSFDAEADEEERRFFNNLPTNFHLPADTVDRLRELSRRQIREDADFQALVGSLRELHAASQSSPMRKSSSETRVPSSTSIAR